MVNTCIKKKPSQRRLINSKKLLFTYWIICSWVWIISKKYCQDSDIMNEIANNLTLESIGHQSTAFLIGLNYHSRCHTDVEMFYTLATVIAPKGICADDVIYYFMFSTVGIMISLRSGDSFLCSIQYFRTSVLILDIQGVTLCLHMCDKKQFLEVTIYNNIKA